MTDDDMRPGWKLYPVISEVLEMPDEDIYFRQRRRKAGRQGQYEKLAGDQEFFIVEGGRSFLSDQPFGLSRYGAFPRSSHHARDGPRGIEGQTGIEPLLLTGSFSVYAAAGGAAGWTPVDLSKTYLNWAEANMALNGPVEADTAGSSMQMSNNGWTRRRKLDYDLVVMDPPTFSNSKRMKDFLDIQRDHAELINKTLRA